MIPFWILFNMFDREGHGHEAGDEGYWLMWVATDNLDVQGRQVSPGVDRDFSPTPPPKC